LIQIKTTIDTLLPTRNKFHYSTVVEISGSGADKFVEGALCSCLIIEDFLLQAVAQALEKVADDAEFRSVIRSVPGAFVVKCAVWHYHEQV
jgi:hypothetical protein